MKSGWFWNTSMWEEYLTAYYTGRERPDVYQTSPFDQDSEVYSKNGSPDHRYTLCEYQTQVIDLTQSTFDLWGGVRKSYRPLITRATDRYEIEPLSYQSILSYQALHAKANGKQPRPDRTYEIQGEWLQSGYGLLIAAHDWDHISLWHAAAYWIIYQDCACYMSGPSVTKNVQHAVIWHSLELLKARGIKLVEMGQIDGETEKELSIGKFKQGFGGDPRPFIVATRVV